MRKKVVDKKNLNFTNISKKLMIYGLALQIILTTAGCEIKKTNYNEAQNSYEYTNDSNDIDNYDNKSISSKDNAYLSNNINVLLNQGFDNTLYNIESIKITYPFEELFNESYSVNNFVGNINNELNHDTSLLVGGKISSSNLYSKVLENNENYSNKSLKKDLSSSELNKICNYIAESVNEEIINNKVNANEVACTLSDLKIFEINSVNDASVNGDNCLLVTPSIINNNAKKYSNFDYYKYVIQHEAKHLCQLSCNHIIGDIDHKYGFAEFKENDQVNMYEYLWLSEAHASIAASKMQNQEPISYKSYVSYLNLIDFTNGLNITESLSDLALSRNINDLYNYFDTNSEIEKRDVDKLMFSLDIVLNSNKKFMKSYSNLNSGISESDMKQYMKISICESLSKQFYKTLIKYAKDNSMNLDDIFYLITVFEANLNDKLYFSSESDYENNKEFFEIYTSLQNEFFNIVALNSKLSMEDIITRFNNYSLYKEDGNTINCSYSFNNFMNGVIKKLHTSETYFSLNIRQYKTYFENKILYQRR